MPQLHRQRATPTNLPQPRAPRPSLGAQKGKLVILSFFLAVSGLLAQSVYVANQLHKRGEIIQAKVTRKLGSCTPETMSGAPPCFVWYEFEREGRKYTGWSELDSDSAPHVSSGFLFPVRYLPDNPSQNELAGEGHRHSERDLLVFLALAGSGISFYSLLRRPRIKPRAPLLQFRPLEEHEIAKAYRESRYVWWVAMGTLVALAVAAGLDFQGGWGDFLVFLFLVGAVVSVVLWLKRQKLLHDLKDGVAEVLEGRVDTKWKEHDREDPKTVTAHKIRVAGETFEVGESDWIALAEGHIVHVHRLPHAGNVLRVQRAPSTS